MCDLQDLKSGVNHMGEKNHEKFVEVDRKLDIVKHEIKSSKEYYLNDHEAIKHHSEKIIDLEDRSRRNNLRIDGIKECAGESAEQTEEKVRLMLRQNLNIETKIEIDRAHRVGKPKNNKPRTIVMRCNVFKEKEMIKRSANRLRGTGIYINDDFSNETMRKREELFPVLKQMRNQGKGARIVKDRLVCWDRKEKEKNLDADTQEI